MASKGSLSEPVRPHWFYCPPAGEKSPWLPLSYEDSHKLEEAYAWSQELGQEQEKDVVVPVEGSRYDVRLKERSRHAVYWSEPPSEVRRGLWFYKGSKESGYTPYPEDASHILEEAYRSAVALNEWRKKVELPTGGTIFLQSPKSCPHPAQRRPTPPTEPTPSRVVVRGLENVQIDIPEGEPDTVDHLVFMVHGIGPTCDLRMRTLVHCVNDFRSASLGLINSHFRETEGLSGIGRVEFLPITWHDVLHSDTGVDKDMERITLPSISVLRHFGNDTLLDVFFYNSPKYCQVIVDTVASDINRLHALFLQRHPGFTGAVSLAGHSLGSIILFDLLTNQKKSTEEEVVAEESDDSCQSDKAVTASDMSVTASDESETASDESVMASDESESLEDILRGRGLEEHLHVLQREQVDSESLLLCTENDLKDLGIPLGPRKKILDLAKKFKRSRAGTSLPVPNGRVAQETAGPPPHGTRIPEGTTSSSTISYHCSGVGTGQVSVNYPQLAFSPQAFFALGSPIGMFLTVRGLKRMAPDYSLPTCKSFYNIYHPYDPVAYRIEPLVLPAGVELPPVLLPHYKGRKRMHLELRDGLTRVSSEVLGSLRNVWQVFSQVPNSALPLLGQGSDAAFNTSSDTQDDRMSVATGTSQEAQRKDVKVGMLNGGRRFDYVLQEKPIEIFNQYLFAIQSHLCYWESEDTALLVLREIYEQQKAPGSHPTHAAGGDVVM
ncbi:phospholipase DDHD2 [Clupea harengus]|uniref:Phospholipase DDHD2 n=1 Tax=Clupea harengus TaxID=7950 RepID=A0A8M1KNE1_CLUHA|nr:phospholipase DDHD2 [Clupea harengus]